MFSGREIDNYLDCEEDVDDYINYKNEDENESNNENDVSNKVCNKVSNDVCNDVKSDVNDVVSDNVNSDANEVSSNKRNDEKENESNNECNVQCNDDVNNECNVQCNDDVNNKTNTSSSSPSQPSVSIEISSTPSSTQPLTPESITSSIDSAKQEFITSLANDVAQLEQTNNISIDISQYTSPHSHYRSLLLSHLFVPSFVTTTLSMNQLINSITTFTYETYDSPNTSLQHKLSESVIHLKRLSSIFNFEFLSSVTSKWKFDELDDKIATYLTQYKTLPSTKLEYELIKTFIGKLIISLETTTERAFREQQTPLVNAQYRSVISYDVAVMNKLQSDTKWFQSWSKFMDAFFATKAENFVYIHSSYEKLNEHLSVAYDNDYLIEILFANILKCYFPSISLNYFYVVKCAYLIARMVNVYVHKLMNDKEFKNKDLTTVMNDLNTIAAVGVIIYENKNYIIRQTAHSLPKSNNNSDISEKTKMYILNHLFTGGQYYILKMFEKCLPSIGIMIDETKGKTKGSNDVSNNVDSE